MRTGRRTARRRRGRATRIALPIAVPMALGLALGIIMAVSGGNTTTIDQPAFGGSASPAVSASTGYP